MSKIKIYLLSCDKMKDSKIYEVALNELPEYRQKKAEKMKQERDKRLSVGAGLLIKHVLEKAGGSEDEIFYGSKGKPYLKGKKVFFNVSHSGEYAICAVADTEVGCDIEKIEKADMKLAKKCFSEHEYESLCGCETEKERNILFFRYWTMRESYVKALGTGITTPFRSFFIDFDGENPEIRTALADRKTRLTEIKGPDGYCCSVCTINEENGNFRLNGKDVKPEIEIINVELRDLLIQNTEDDMEEKLLFKVNVHLTGNFFIEGHAQNVCMLPFTGDAEGDYFNGNIIAVAADTQYLEKQGGFSISARYMLEGKDCEGNDCRVFIENNGKSLDECYPKMITDSPVLGKYETAGLKSNIVPCDGGVTVYIRVPGEAIN